MRTIFAGNHAARFPDPVARLVAIQADLNARAHARREIARTAQALHVAAPQYPEPLAVDEYFTRYLSRDRFED